MAETLKAATSFAYSASASGLYVESDLLRKLGLGAEVGRKGFRVMGEPVAAVVARGCACLGFQQMSELLCVDGVDVVGPLPAELQQLSILAAGIPSSAKDVARSRALIAGLLSDEARALMLATGLMPKPFTSTAPCAPPS